MATRLSTAARNAACDAVVDLVDADASVGYIEIRTGTQPAGPDTAATGTMLVDIDFADPSYGGSSSGVATLQGTPLLDTAGNTGTAGWFRIYDGAATGIIDGDVTATAGGGDLELVSTSITSGQPVQISSGTHTQPASE